MADKQAVASSPGFSRVGRERALWLNKQSMPGREQERSPWRGPGRGLAPTRARLCPGGAPGRGAARASWGC